MDGSLGFGDAAPPCPQTCSDDLTSVVDCQGNVISTCGNGLACGSDLQCHPPCDATSSLKSSLGCNYVISAPMDDPGFAGSCYAVLVANAWTSPVLLSASYGNRALDMSQIARIPTGSGSSLTLQPLPADGLHSGQLAVLFLADRALIDHGSNSTACPAGIQAGVTDVDVSLHESGIGQAFTIASTGPVVAYDMWPYGGAKSQVTSASLLLPTSAWGTSYMGLHAWTTDPMTTWSTYLQIIANADTTLTMWPTNDIPADGGIAGGQKGQPYQTALTAGQFLQVSGPDLTGTILSSSAPVGVMGGNNALDIPAGTQYADTAHQQLLPVNSLGSVYVAARYRDRQPGADEHVPYRILGIVKDTQLTYDPPLPPSTGALTTATAGQVITITTDTDFSVRSQDADHPFYVSGHMTGAWAIIANQGVNDQGDPDFVNLVTPSQYRRSYVFLTDPTYANTHLVFVRQKTSGGYQDVTLDCAGAVGGWTNVDTAGEYQVAKVDVVAGGVPVGSCDNGVHAAKSTAPFGLTVWGWDSYVSYAFPAGMFVESINNVVPTPN